MRHSISLTAALLLTFAALFFWNTLSSNAQNQSAAEDLQRSTVSEARRQAKLLHAAMHATLHLMHQQLYREDEGLPIPAAVVDDIFEDIEREEQVKLQWLVVEGQAMNTDHIAKTDFEEQAVSALKSGKESFEEVTAGMFRRAAPVVLSNQCLKCHVPDRRSTENRIAGMIVSIPIIEED